MEKSICTNRVRNKEILRTVKEERNGLHKVQGRKANLIIHILRRNCLVNHVIEGTIEGGVELIERQGKRCKRLLDDIKETRGCWKLND